jgi:hypothetical protein
VAEQLGVEQRLGNGADIDGDKALAMPRTGVVNGARHHLLAGAGLAGNENGGGGRRHGLDQLKQRAHRRALAGHGAQAKSLIELLMQIRVFALQALLLERVGEDMRQLVELKRLGNEVRGAGLDHVHGVLHRTVAGDHNRDDIRVAGQGLVDDRAAIHARQAEVRDDDVEGKSVESLEGRLAVGGLGDHEAFVRKSFSYNTSEGFLIIDEEEMRHGRQDIDGLEGISQGCTANLRKAGSDTPFGGKPQWNGKQ